MSGEPIDLVYTWVDDAFPGYRAQLGAYAQSGHDSNPNRTRDNLDLLRYSMRSVERFLPWVRNIHLLSCRPQVPAWLDVDHPRIRVVHHDAIMRAELLPTFNSFAIVSHLHLLPGLSQRFVYLEDDILLGRPLERDFFLADNGRVRVWPWPAFAQPARDRGRTDLSMWDRALAHSNHALDRVYGPQRRHKVQHAPWFIDRADWERMLARWPGEFAQTRRSRFRAPGNLAPEFLYPQYLREEGRAVFADPRETRRRLFYHGLENCRAWNSMRLARIARQRPASIALNDNFGRYPRPRVVAAVRRFLDRRFPWPAPFEKVTR